MGRAPNSRRNFLSCLVESPLDTHGFRGKRMSRIQRGQVSDPRRALADLWSWIPQQFLENPVTKHVPRTRLLIGTKFILTYTQTCKKAYLICDFLMWPQL